MLAGQSNLVVSRSLRKMFLRSIIMSALSRSAGNICQAISMSCTATTRPATFNLNITEFQRLEKSIDLLGFFNTLDHQDKPLEILTEAVNKARYVVVELHDDRDAGKQHLFVINQALVRSAKENRWNCKEFSSEHPPRRRESRRPSLLAFQIE